MTFGGVSVDTLLERAGGLDNAAFVLAHSHTGYTTSLTIEDVTDGKAWVVWNATTCTSRPARWWPGSSVP
jgi:DMSO/TMAO reductase YedYZ molybdopterin-dependent catalytic subunit